LRPCQRAAELGQAQREYSPEVSLGGNLSRDGDDALPNDYTAGVRTAGQSLLQGFGGRTRWRGTCVPAILHRAAGPDPALRSQWRRE
jgi:hypothetical protein